MLGSYNEYTGYGSIVSGYFDEALGDSDVVFGEQNTASGEATGELASVSGGYRNKATSTESSVLGGKKIKFDTQYGVSP